MREDSIRLFGFSRDAERDWFRLLQSVQGVGAKVALAILSILPPDELANAIAMQDKAMVSRAPGVGPKLAARIVAELKDKAPAFAAVDSRRAPRRRAPPTRRRRRGTRSRAVGLGYGRPQAAAAVARTPRRWAGRRHRRADPRGLKELAQ